MADLFELNVTWVAPHPRLPAIDGQVPLVWHARTPRRFGTRTDAFRAADAAVHSVGVEQRLAAEIEATVHRLRFDVSGTDARVTWRQHVATTSASGRIEHDVKDDQELHR